MVDLKNINDNIIANRWKTRYASQSDEVKEKLDKLDNAKVEEYQLKIIKRRRIYPQIGDLFKVNPVENIELLGIVINNHVNNINGEDLLVILIFQSNTDIKKICESCTWDDMLLLPPQIVGKEYWSRGYFYNIDKLDILDKKIKYGFYDIFEGKYVNEYGKELPCETELLGLYSVSTLTGVARKINQELVIAGIL